MNKEITNRNFRSDAIIVIHGYAKGDSDKLKKIYKILNINDIDKIWLLDPPNSKLMYGKKGSCGAVQVKLTKEGKIKLKHNNIKRW